MSTYSKNKPPLYHAETLLEEFDFRKIFYKLIDHKWLILAVTSLCFLLGMFYIINLPPKYVSTALIQVDSQLGTANNMQQMLGSMSTTFSPGGQASPADIEIALIRSPFILQSVMEKLHLNVTVHPYHFPYVGDALARHHHEEGVSKPLFGLSQFAWGGEKIELQNFEASNLFEGSHFRLRAEGGNKYSVFTTDGVLLLHGTIGKPITQHDEMTQIKIFVKELKANPGTYFDIALRHGDDVVKQISQNLSIVDLGTKDKTKTGVLQLTYQGNNPAFIPKILDTIIDYAIQRNIEKKSAEASKTLDFLNRQLPNVRKSLENAETDLNEYRATSGTIDISQEAKIILMQLSAVEQSIADARLKKVEMLQELTPEHPFVIALTRKQSQLHKEVINLESKIKSLPRTDQRALSLERDVKVKDQLYLLLLNKIQQLQVLKAGTLSDIRILNQATTPIMPLPTHKLFTLLVFILFGFILSLGLIFLRDLFQHGVSDTELVEDRLGIPTFAIIPYSMKQKQYNREMKRRLDMHRPFVLAQIAPKDIAIEGIRSLRTMLQFTLEQAENNIISVLGPSPGIGKSFLSTNLARILVDSGKRVLLIDCDMRKGKTNQYLGQKKTPGFSELLTGKKQTADVISHVDSRFDFIACGDYPKHPSEILMTEQLKVLLKQFSQEYDIVIIDTPPVLAVTDGVIIAKQAATNLMIIGSGTNHLEELELMVKRVKRNGVEIHGLVFNNNVQTKREYGQYNYYYAYENLES